MVAKEQAADVAAAVAKKKALRGEKFLKSQETARAAGPGPGGPHRLPGPIMDTHLSVEASEEGIGDLPSHRSEGTLAQRLRPMLRQQRR